MCDVWGHCQEKSTFSVEFKCVFPEYSSNQNKTPVITVFVVSAPEEISSVISGKKTHTQTQETHLHEQMRGVKAG